MKNYCDKCNVKIEQEKAYCPLCGRCCNEELIGVQKKSEHFPSDAKFVKDRKRALRVIANLLVLGNLISLIVELSLNGSISWSLMVFVSTIFFFVAMIFPIKSNWSMVNYHTIFYICIPFYIIFMQWYTNTGFWGTSYVIPLFALLFSIYNFSMVLSNRNTRGEYFIPMLILVIIGVAAFIYNNVSGAIIWPSLSAFITTISFTTLLVILKSTKIGGALGKKFHI